MGSDSPGDIEENISPDEIPPENDVDPAPDNETEVVPEVSTAPDDVVPEESVPEGGETVEPEEVEIQLSVKKSVETAEDESLRLRYEAWVDTAEEWEKIQTTGFTALFPEGQTWDWELSDPEGQIGYFDVQRDDPEWGTYVGEILDPVQGSGIWTDAIVWIPQEEKIQPDSFVYFVDVPEGVQDVSELNSVLFLADGEFVNVKYESDWENAELLNQPEETPEPTVTPTEVTPSPEEPPVQEEQQPDDPEVIPDESPAPEEEQTPIPEVSQAPEKAGLSVTRSICREDSLYLKYSISISKDMQKKISSTSPLTIVFPEDQTIGQEKDAESGFKVIGKDDTGWSDLVEYLEILDDGMYSHAAVWMPGDENIPEMLEYKVVISDGTESIENIKPALFYCGREEIIPIVEDEDKDYNLTAVGDKTFMFRSPPAPNEDAQIIYNYHFEYSEDTSLSEYPAPDGELILTPSSLYNMKVPENIKSWVICSSVDNLQEGYVAYNDEWSSSYYGTDWTALTIQTPTPEVSSEKNKSSTLTLMAPSVQDSDAVFTFLCHFLITPSRQKTVKEYQSSIGEFHTRQEISNIKSEFYVYQPNDPYDLGSASLSFTVTLKQGQSFTIGGLCDTSFAVEVEGHSAVHKYILNEDRWTGYVGCDISYKEFIPTNLFVNPSVLSENGSENDYAVKFEKLSKNAHALNSSGVGGIFSHDMTSKKRLKGAVLQLTGREYGSSTDITPKTWVSPGTEGIFFILKPGQYVLREIQTPPGYLKAPDIEFEITYEGKLVIGKDGVMEIEQGISSEDGTSFYYGEGSRVVDMIDEEPVEILISKKDYNHNDVLSGAIFKITGNDAAGNEIEPVQWTSTNEPYSVSLLPGTYTLSEVSAPEGYKRLDNSLKFKIYWDDFGLYPQFEIISGNDNYAYNVEGETYVFTVEIDNYREYAELRVEKVDADTNEPLAGAELQLTGQETSGTQIAPIKWTTDGNPYVLKLNPGKYTLSELSAPFGYNVADSVEFTVDDNCRVNPVNNSENFKLQDNYNYYVLTMQDKSNKRKVHFYKYRYTYSGDEVPLATAGFLLTSSDPDLSNVFTPVEWTTDSMSQSVDLYPGTYTLTETKVPKGYLKAEDTVFTLDESGKITILSGKNSSIDSENNLKINVCDVTYYVEFKKLDYNHQNVFVPGAHLELTGSTSDGTPIETVEWISRDSSHIEQLLPGNYTVKETVVPDGYIRDLKEINFTLKDDGSIEIDGEIKDSVDIYNTREGDEGSFPVTFYKYKSVVGKDGDPKVYGATLRITGKDNDYSDSIFSSSSIEGRNTLYLMPGTYILHETRPPSLDYGQPYSFAPAEDIEFTVTDQGKVLIDGKEQETASVTMYDDPLIYIVKYSSSYNIAEEDGDSFFVNGAKLKICGSNEDGSPNYDDIIDQWTNGWDYSEYWFDDAGDNEVLTQPLLDSIMDVYITYSAGLCRAVHVSPDEIKNGVWLIEESAPDGYLPADPIHITADDLYNYIVVDETHEFGDD